MTHFFMKKISIFLIFSIIFTVLPLNRTEAQSVSGVVFVKTQAHPTVFMIQNGQKYAIRNEAVFKSYGVDWSEVHHVSEQQLMQYPTARLLRATGDPAIYYLDYRLNKKHVQPTEQIFKQYGNRFEDVLVVSQSDLNAWEDMKLVKTSSSPSVYYLEGNRKRLIPSEHDFIALDFSWSQIATIAPFDLAYYQDGERLTAHDAQKIRIVKEPVTNGSLRITREDHQAVTALRAYTNDNLYMRIALSSEEMPVSVKSIEFRQSGHVLGRGSYIYLLEKGQQDAVRHATSLEGEYARIHFTNNELTLPPYTKKVFDVYVSIGGITESKIGHSISVSDVESTSGVMDFHVRSPFYNIIFDRNLITKVGVDTDKIIRDTNRIVMSNTSQNITQFTFQVMNEQEDVYLKRLIIENQGNVSLNELTDIHVNISASGSSKNTSNAKAKNRKPNREVNYFYKKGKYRGRYPSSVQKKSSTPPGSSNLSGIDDTIIERDRIILTLENNPAVINKDQELKVIVSANLSGRQEGEVLNLMIADPSDIELVGAESNQFIVAQARGLNDRSFPIGDRIEAPFNVITTGHGESSISIATASSKTPLAAGAKSVSLAEIQIKNGREDAQIERLDVKIANPGSTSLGTTLRVKHGGKVVGSANASGYMNRFAAIKLTEPVKANQNQTVTLSFEVDVPFETTANDSYQLSMRNPELRTGNTNISYVINEEVTAYKLNVMPFAVSVRVNPDTSNLAIP
ncbi:MAG TPA: hypothetical protein VJA22_01540, partial [Patescibacteria group bacterium]|nr:hypothetical protein [Patescibacteria group bacterium]